MWSKIKFNIEIFTQKEVDSNLNINFGSDLVQFGQNTVGVRQLKEKLGHVSQQHQN